MVMDVIWRRLCVSIICSCMGSVSVSSYRCCMFVSCVHHVAVHELWWVELLCWIDRVWSSKECVCCACDSSVHLDVPSIGFVCVCICRKLSPHLGV